MAEPLEHGQEQHVDEQSTRQVVVIIGASSGIGRATALEFAQNGYDVVLAARRKKELDDVAKACKDYGASTLVVPTDITDDKAVHTLAEAAMQRFQHIDIWVNDAGVYLTGKFQDIPLEDMRRVMETNFFGYIHGSHAALSEFRKSGHGTLINISSVNAAAPMPYLSVYSASKAAIRALDESLRMELRLDGLHNGIHVCTVMPATVDTNIFQNSANYTGKELLAIDPVYEPEYVAGQIVKLAKRPKREVIIGPSGKLLAMQNAHMPGMYEKWMSKYAEMDTLGDAPASITDGNLFDPIEHNRGTHGGWRSRKVRADHLNIGIGAALTGAIAAGIAVAIVTRNRKQQAHSVLPDRERGLLHALFA